METREYSDIQEKEIAKYLNGKVQANSGGGKFNGGDIIVDDFMIEAKTTEKAKSSFTIKKEWIDKVKKQSMEQQKAFWSLAFRFEPTGEDYFIINKQLLKDLVRSKSE
jgi:hypothetical protein